MLTRVNTQEIQIFYKKNWQNSESDVDLKKKQVTQS